MTFGTTGRAIRHITDNSRVSLALATVLSMAAALLAAGATAGAQWAVTQAKLASQDERIDELAARADAIEASQVQLGEKIEAAVGRAIAPLREDVREIRGVLFGGKR